MQYSGRLLAAAFCLIAGTQAANANLIHNGSFTTGNFAGWTLATTANGSLGFSPVPDVVSFDVTGAGVQKAAQLEAGQAAFVPGDQEGGSLSQMITTTSGPLKFHFDFAAYNPGALPNAEAGVFSVLLDGMLVVVGLNFGLISPGAISRSSITLNLWESAGNHNLELLVTRPFLNQNNGSPYEYLTNISATQAQAPEPLTVAVFGSGLACLAGMRRRIRRKWHSAFGAETH